MGRVQRCHSLYHCYGPTRKGGADSAPPSTGMETSWPQQVTVDPFRFYLPLGLSFIVDQCDWSPRTRLHRQISVCATEKKEALKNSLL